MFLRPYQEALTQQIQGAWSAGNRNVLAVLPTGGGKTICFGYILKTHQGAACVIAHRQELVGQISLTLARLGIRHRIIAPTNLIREIVSRHMSEVGHSYYDPNAPIGVAGVDTLIRRDLGVWGKQVTLWVLDEGHHLLAKNKWGKAAGMFPNAFGLGVTATPLRADGQGLGAHADGLYHSLIVGVEPRWLIDNGFLTDYRIFAPKSDIDYASVPISDATGDFNQTRLRVAAKKSHIVGDVVESYLKIAPGRLGVTFCVSVDIATETAARFRAAGIPAEVVSADTPELVRAAIIHRFAKGDIRQLCNVDLFGEGFDLPAIEVVSMSRPTESYGLFSQQFGRSLRPMEGKDSAIIIDHVGNVLRHGLPDTPHIWSLDRRERRSRNAQNVTPVKVCPACTAVYERFRVVCPYCGHEPVPAERSAPEMVDGDLYELDPEFLQRLRNEQARIDGPARVPQGLGHPAAIAVQRNHANRQLAQHHLRDRIAWWAGWQNANGLSDREAYRKFWISYNVDVATAQTLGTEDANRLAERIDTDLTNGGVRL